MAYENRPVQSSTTNTLPTGTDPAVDNTSVGDVQLIKLLTGAPGAVVALDKAEDSAHTDGDSGVMMLAVRKDTATALADADGKYIPLIVDSSGRLWVNIGASALPTGAATAANQDTANTALASLVTQTDAVEGSLASIDADIGAQADAAASSDTGSFSVIAFIKRGMQNWTTLLARIPALVSGRVPVDGSGVTQPVSGPLTDAQLRASAVPVSGPLTDAQLRATPVPVSTSALPLPAGAATEATLSAANAKLPPLFTTVPDNEVSAPPSRQVGQDIWAASFSAVGSGLLDTQFASPIHLDAGVGVSQAGGALVVTTGVGANAEFLARSVRSWRGAWTLRVSTVLSQRIANQNFGVVMADLIGEDLTYTINSATSVTVAIPGHTYTAENVGQSMNIAALDASGPIPGRYAIASVVAGTSITFTVAGWPVSGTGTCTLFGHSFYRVIYSGTTATAAAYDAQRRGWASGDSTLTINSTAGAGHILQLETTGRTGLVYDAVRASTSTPSFSSRGSRYENIPDDNLDLYLWLWSYNGSTAPASTTTWTISFCSVEKFANVPVYIAGNRAVGVANPMPIAFAATGAVQGQQAQAATPSGSPLVTAIEARTTAPTAVTNGQVARLTGTVYGVQVTKPYAVPELEWAGGNDLTTTTAAALVLAAGAGLKRHITAIQAINTGASTVSLIILDGATERWRLPLPVNVPVAFEFPNALPTTAATALNVNLSAAGTVRVNGQGYTAP